MNDKSNPYTAVIADLRSKRDQIDQIIQSLEALQSGGNVMPFSMQSASTAANGAAAGDTG